jgi:hypothetical protein
MYRVLQLSQQKPTFLPLERRTCTPSMALIISVPENALLSELSNVRK